MLCVRFFVWLMFSVCLCANSTNEAVLTKRKPQGWNSTDDLSQKYNKADLTKRSGSMSLRLKKKKRFEEKYMDSFQQ